jgi:site-specific recombinase XerD
LQTEFLHRHQAQGHSPKTIAHYRCSFALFDRFLKETGHELVLSTLTTPVMTAFVTWLRETPIPPYRGRTTRTDAGIHGICRDLRAFTRYLSEEGLLDRPPKIILPKLAQDLFPILSDADLERIFACRQLTPANEIGTRNRALFAFMLDTGVRLSEVAGLGLADLDLADGMARVRGKGNKERLVFFSPGVTADLRRWLAIRGDDDGPVFWLAPEGIRMLFRRIKDETGLPTLHPHVVRHTSATQLLNGGADLHAVRRILGHSSLAVTERYLSLSSADLKQMHTSSSPYERLRDRVAPEVRKRRRLKAR